MRKRIVCMFALFITGNFCFSEIIIFKSGKTENLKILERTDAYVKVDISGIPIKYYLDEIETIDGKPAYGLKFDEEEISQENEAGVTTDNNVMDWHLWHSQVDDYIVNKTVPIVAELGEVVAAYMRVIKESMSEKDKKRLLQETQKKLFDFGQRLKAIQPPLDLGQYHEKIINAWKDVNTFFTEEYDYFGLVDSSKQFTKAQIEIVEEIKRLFIKHNAPADYIESQSSLIVDLQNNLKQYWD